MHAKTAQAQDKNQSILLVDEGVQTTVENEVH